MARADRAGCVRSRDTWIGGFAGTGSKRSTRTSVREASVGPDPVDCASVSAAPGDGVGFAGTVRLRPRGVTEQALQAGRDLGRATQARSTPRVLVGFRPRWRSASHALPVSSRFRPARREAARAWSSVHELRLLERTTARPVSDVVDECPAGPASSGHWVTRGRKQAPGNGWLRTAEQHESDERHGSKERWRDRPAQSSERLAAVVILCSGAQG